MQEITKRLEDLLERVQSAMDKLGLASDRTHLTELEQQMAAPDFWQDAGTAADASQQAADIRKRIDGWDALRDDIQSALELARLGDGGIQKELQHKVDEVERQLTAREVELQLSGVHDRNDAILIIQAGAGGTDAQDWAEMLLRMFLRYAERMGWRASVVDQSSGEEAGIKSATVEVAGAFAYGKLQSESGVHRLVRLSPYNSDNLRQTSFARVEVLPQLNQNDKLEIDAKDLRIDVFRSGGRGGQSVNTTDSAVRITHLPTGTVVAIQNERSQLQNKEKAMVILKARLQQLLEAQHKSELGELRGVQASAEWGSQIRSYVLHPYTKVKDHRTGHETSQVQEVLDGTLAPFVDAYLNEQVGK